MNAEFINPFINAATNVLKTMAAITPEAGKPYLKTDSKTWGVVTGIIGMAGNEISGNMVISFDQGSILEIVNKMLMESYTEVSDEVVDAVGEITNMITGGAKKELSESGCVFEMATPVMLKGQGTELKQLAAVPVIVLPFTTGAGKFVIEANLARRK